MADAQRAQRTEDTLRLFAARGNSQYGGENVTQLQHALQAAFFAERHGATANLIAASLLHDVGHLLHALPEDAPAQGIDDAHETLAARWLVDRFAPAVCEPVRMHVLAKRYLCAVDETYHAQLSAPSQHSLELQGGRMTDAEAEAFAELPYAQDSVQLRRWDDAAKVVNLETPDIQHYAKYLEMAD